MPIRIEVPRASRLSFLLHDTELQGLRRRYKLRWEAYLGSCRRSFTLNGLPLGSRSFTTFFTARRKGIWSDQTKPRGLRQHPGWA